jgi:polar amino acid transport system substrate-binding protein
MGDDSTRGRVGAAEIADRKEFAVKKSLALVALAVLAATAAVARSAPLSAPTKTPGTLTVGFDVPAPGFWNGRVTGTTIKNPTGFEAGLAQAIAAKLGIAKVVFVRAPFGGLFSPAPKKYDFAMEEATITPERAKVVTFSTPYFTANQGVLIRKGLAKPTSLADLKKIQLCAQADTTGLAYVQHTLRPAKKPLVYSASSTAAFDAVEAGRCDALILDVPIVASQARKKPGAYGGVVGQIVTNEFYGAIMEKGSKLKPDLDSAIKALKADGTITRLTKKWLLNPIPPALK